MLKLKQTFVGIGLAAIVCGSGPAQATTVPVNEGFEGPGLPPGWVHTNNSSLPPPALLDGSWQKPLSPPPFFTAQAGTDNSYYADSNGAALGVGANNISDWLFTPTFTIGNGTHVTFYTRSTGEVPDRLQVRLSTSGNSTNVGNTATSVGNFTTLLADINPTLSPGGYPMAWVPISLDVSGLSGLFDGRVAFRYFIMDNEANGAYIGIDTVVITSVPEPEMPLMMALGFLALGWGLRRKSRR